MLKTKKYIALLLLLFISIGSWAQLVATTPQLVTQDNVVIDLIFDASLGNGGLNDYAGTDVYAHTGVITNLSTSNGDWKHAPAWLDNSAKYKLTSLGNNKWKFSITPSISLFYGLATGEKVTKLAFVFRNGTGSLQGKDVGGADIFIDVYQAGLNVAFTNPTTNQSLLAGTVLNIQIGASEAADLNLLVNGISVKTATASTTLSYSYTFASALDYSLIAEATTGSTTLRDTLYVCVPATVTTETRPSGVIDGINYVDSTTATFVMYAPGKTNVFLIGEFNNWVQLNAYQMKKDGDYWWYTLSGITPRKVYGFQYLVDGNLKICDAYTEMVLDPWNDKYINSNSTIYPNLKPYPEGKTDGLVATLETKKTTYNWEISTFTIPPAENMVIYELLLRDFTTEKSLNAAITKLDYLDSLGITAIELMPITEFDGNNSWGYNPNHYFAPDKAYGTPEMYKKFIDECHKRGIAVILDMVFNQASGQCPFAMLYWDAVNNRPATNNPWMNLVAPHPYSVFNDFNHSFSGTKEYFKRVLQYWITEYKIDGYRMDLTKGFTQTVSTEATASNYDQSRIDNLTEYYNAAKAVKSDVIFILEHFCSSSEETVLANKGMYLWRNINNSYSQSAMGYQSDSDFSGMNTTPRQWVGYAESHDEERNFYKAKTYGAGNLITDSIARIKRIPLNIAFTTLIPGPKMIWEFGEMGYDYSINSFGGRTNEKPSVWSWLNLKERKAAADASAKIINLRKQFPKAFTEGNFTFNISGSDWSLGRKIILTHADLNMVVLGNFDATTTISAIPDFPKTGVWYNLLTGEELNITNTNMSMDMLPGSLLIFTDKQITEPMKQTDCYVYPTITNGKVYISTTSTLKNISIYNIQGLLLKTGTSLPEIDLTNFNKGLYIMDVSTLQDKYSFKIIKN